MKVWYLYHSGFAVETDNFFLVFDYWKDCPAGGLSQGFINPEEIAGKRKRVVVFASHEHADHYNPAILGWKEALPDIEFVLSDDIPAVDGALMAAKNKTYELRGLTVCTLESNDLGVAFLVKMDDLQIYHAGDLNWWHWDGEPDEFNRDMEVRYKEQIDKLSGLSIDLAFVPVDPRLGDQYAWGADYLMRTAQVKQMIPMHFMDNPEVIDRFLSDPVSTPYRDRIIPLKKPGQMAECI